MHENEIGKLILNAAFTVHTALGPGLLESTYESCLCCELLLRGLVVETQVPLPVIYRDRKLPCGYRLDILVNQKVIVEIKSVETVSPIHIAQMLTYLKLSNYRLGYLINFNELHLKDGIRRLVMNLRD